MKDLVAVADDGKVYGFYHANGSIVAVECPDLTIIDNPGEIQSKCGSANTRSFTVEQFKRRLMGVFWSPTLREEAKTSTHQGLLEFSAGEVLSFEDKRRRLREEINKIQTFMDRFPGTAGTYVEKLEALRAEFDQGRDLEPLVASYKELIEGVIEKILDSTQVSYVTTFNPDDKLMVLMLQSLFSSPKISYGSSSLRSLTPSFVDGVRINSGSPAPLQDGRIVYQSMDTSTNKVDLWIVDPDSLRRDRLTKFDESHGEVDSQFPVQLPDGRILYTADYTKDGVYELWTINLETMIKERFATADDTSQKVQFWIAKPLPDGRIVHTAPSGTKESIDLWLYDPATKQQTNITKRQNPNVVESLHLQNSPAVIPPNKVVYGVKCHSDEIQIVLRIIDLDSNQVTQLPRYGNYIRPCQPHVMPNGKILHAATSRSDNDGTPGNSLWITDLTARTSQQITPDLGFSVPWNRHMDSNPVALGDGRIAFQSNRSGQDTNEIWLLTPTAQ